MQLISKGQKIPFNENFFLREFFTARNSQPALISYLLVVDSLY